MAVVLERLVHADHSLGRVFNDGVHPSAQAVNHSNDATGIKTTSLNNTKRKNHKFEQHKSSRGILRHACLVICSVSQNCVDDLSNEA